MGWREKGGDVGGDKKEGQAKGRGGRPANEGDCKDAPLCLALKKPSSGEHQRLHSFLVAPLLGVPGPQ